MYEETFFLFSISVHRTTNTTTTKKTSLKTNFYLGLFFTQIKRIYIERNICVVSKMENLNYLTRNITSPHVTFTQKSQEQGKYIPYTEIIIYFSNIDNFSKIILLKKLTD